jgi:hypothetical protein
MGIEVTPAVYRNPRYERQIALLYANLGELAIAVQSLVQMHTALRELIQAQNEMLPGEYRQNIREYRPH